MSDGIGIGPGAASNPNTQRVRPNEFPPLAHQVRGQVRNLQRVMSERRSANAPGSSNLFGHSLHGNRDAILSRNLKYTHDQDAWRKQGYSDALYTDMMHALSRIREMGFSEHTDSHLLDLLHKHINSITKGVFTRGLTEDQVARLVELVLNDLMGEHPGRKRNFRGSFMPGEW